MMNIIKSLKQSCFALCLLGVSVGAKANLFDNGNGKDIDDFSDVTKTVSENFSWGIKLLAAALCTGAAVFIGYHILEAYTQAKRTGSWGALSVWVVLGLVLGMTVIWFGTNAYSSASDISSIKV